ncbi:hypothetical protein [Hymenobacter cellulosivorans]|uniref:SH3 domain-containing protein n=1 Tax=Hymenobacter cellulosivorans TaxID=2932249 RepID=A0ABY4F2J5_9BACT|nr:hypothetical protein [Hymenobacter cellulosivorans]UOQ50889.1 hypothetical protein MUN80_14095 [Hymenobacter cellulosivorans]
MLAAAVVGTLCACADEPARRQDSELRVDQPAAAPQAPSSPPSVETSPPAPVTGSRYRVRAETAYFYDSPRQTKPTGQYLRRGDVLYGQMEGNGFVRTQFVNPAGATITGWLKQEEVSRLATSSAVQRPPARPSAPAETPETPAPGFETGTRASGARTAVVRVARSYFYNSPDLLTPRRAYCEQGDKVNLGQEQGQAVYVTFTNWEKVTTRGWMRKDALR